MKKQLKRWMAVMTASAMLCGAWMTAVPASAAPTDEEVGAMVTEEAVGERYGEVYLSGAGILKCVYKNDGTVKISNGFYPDVSHIKLEIPSVINGYPVSEISDYAFWNCDYLVSVTIPSTVKVIGKEAFAYCDNLKNVKIDEGVKEIGSAAFMYCSSLTRFIFPNSVQTLHTQIFAWCGNLSEVTLSSRIVEVPYGMFHHCRSLKRLTIQGNITTIGEDAFYQCNELKFIQYAKGVTRIGSNRFRQLSSVAKVEIPSTVTYIAPDAFLHGSNGPIIVGVRGTAAESYANTYANPFCELTKKQKTVRLRNGMAYSVGDVITNNRIGQEDYEAVRSALAEYLSFSNVNYVIADANGDGVVNVKDVTHLQRFLVNQLVSLG